MKSGNNCRLKQTLFENVDCIHLRVTSLEEGLKFYCDKLGMKMLWRTDMACGLGTESGSTDIGQCAVVADPWGNKYCLLDTTKGTYDVNADRRVRGVSRKE